MIRHPEYSIKLHKLSNKRLGQKNKFSKDHFRFGTPSNDFAAAQIASTFFHLPYFLHKGTKRKKLFKVFLVTILLTSQLPGFRGRSASYFIQFHGMVDSNCVFIDIQVRLESCVLFSIEFYYIKSTYDLSIGILCATTSG